MNAMTEVRTNIPALAMSEPELMAVLRSSLYPGAKDESIKMVIGWCRAQQKDPMKRPVHIVPMNVKKPGSRDEYEWRDVLMPGIGDYRTDASRTGLYAGIDDATFGPDVHKELGGVSITFPEWCEVTVYRIVGGVRCPFSSGKVRWLETYATTKKDSAAPNTMWRKRPYGQIEKCAESMALRRAFPEVGAQPTAEEMEGRVIEPEAIEGEVVGKSTVEPPKAKSEAEHPKQEPAKPEAPKGDAAAAAVAASPGQIKMIRAKATAATITEEEILKEFGLAALDGISVLTGNCIMKFIEDPASYRAKAAA